MSKVSKWIMPLAHSNTFVFNSSARDFIVEEIPLYEFSGDGEHLILKIRKKDMTTWEMVGLIGAHLGIRDRDIGYAGLKDKHAMTIQYISILAVHEDKIDSFLHSQIKILEKTRHTNKIRIGHLKGNRFQMRFKKVLGVQKDKLDSVLKWIKSNGVPNYFGYQRFGHDANNWMEGKEIVESKKRVGSRKMREFLISSYQSYLFNNWLSKRIEISRLLEEFSEDEVEKIQNLPTGSLRYVKQQKQFFKILEGDIMMHYPHGRVFYAENLDEECDRFVKRDIAPTGLIAGKKSKRSEGVAREIEAMYDEEIGEGGSRRYAWIYPSDVKGKYIDQKAHYELEFFLPKGAYATNIVDMLKGSGDI